MDRFRQSLVRAPFPISSTIFTTWNVRTINFFSVKEGHPRLIMGENAWSDQEEPTMRVRIPYSVISFLLCSRRKFISGLDCM